MLALLATTTSLLVTLYITPAVIYSTFNSIRTVRIKAVTSHIGFVPQSCRKMERIPVRPKLALAKRRFSAKITILKRFWNGYD